MSLKKNINFESFIPLNEFKNLNDFNKIKIEHLIKETKDNIKKKRTYFIHFQKF